jgi:SET domain-containing protein
MSVTFSAMAAAPSLSTDEEIRSAGLWIIGASSIHGRGLFAARAIAAGERIIEYTGERIAKAESTRRQTGGFTFLMELDESFDLDGDQPDNPARFINHACAPNCEVIVEHGQVWIRAAKAIAAGEELTFDYGFRLATFPGHPCRCGAPGCIGFIVGQTERWRARRLLGRVGRSLRPREDGGV